MPRTQRMGSELLAAEAEDAEEVALAGRERRAGLRIAIAGARAGEDAHLDVAVAHQRDEGHGVPAGERPAARAERVDEVAHPVAAGEVEFGEGVVGEGGDGQERLVLEGRSAGLPAGAERARVRG